MSETGGLIFGFPFGLLGICCRPLAAIFIMVEPLPRRVVTRQQDVRLLAKVFPINQIGVRCSISSVIWRIGI